MRVIGDNHKGIGCSYHRVELPLLYMRTSGNSVDAHIVSQDIGEVLNNMYSNDVLFFNRTPTIPLSTVLDMRDKRRFKIVVDVDDHWILYPHHEMAANWKASGAHIQIQESIMAADMVFTTNSRLQVAISALNKKVYVIPNGLPFGDGQFKSYQGVTEGKINFTYATGSSHLHDLTVMRPALKRLGSDPKFKREAEICLAGYQHEYGLGNVNSVWQKMLNIVKQAQSYSTLPVTDVWRYMNSYDHAHVAIAPLEQSAFNACKSNLKILEAGCKGIPIICSNVEPYSLDRECPGVMLATNTEDWCHYVRQMISNKELREDLGRRLQTYVETRYNLYDINKKRIDLFKQLIYGALPDPDIPTSV